MRKKVVEFPKWEGYGKDNIEKMKQFIKQGCGNDTDQILEYAAKMSFERIYFKDLLLFLQYRIEKHFEGEKLEIGIDSSKELFEGLMMVPIDEVSFPEEEKEENDNDKENGEDVYEQFVKDMEKAGIEYEEYHGRYFYHGPAVRTNEKGFPTRQDVIRETKVSLQWDNLGSDWIVYPCGKG